MRRDSLWACFSRVTSSGIIIPEVDGLRFLAVFWVLCFHINGEYIKVMGARFPGQIQGSLYNQVLGTWDFGVQLFFVVSGFILSMPFVDHYWNGSPKPRLGRYYIRRVTRIEPPYIINLIIFAGLIALVKGLTASQLLPHLFASLFYIHNLAYSSVSTINFVTWSLEIEAQFYLTAPWLALLFSRSVFSNRYGFLIAATATAAGVAFGLSHSFPILHLTLVGQLPYFLAGLILAGWYSQHRGLAKPKSYGWDGAGVAAWVAIQILLLVKGPAAALFLPFLIAFGFGCIFRGRVLGMIFTQPLITTVGGMCYTIYLYHPFLKSALKHLVFPFQPTQTYWFNSAIQIFLLGSLIIVVSAVLFLVFEKPFMYRDWPASVRQYVRRLLFRTSMPPQKPAAIALTRPSD